MAASVALVTPNWYSACCTSVWTWAGVAWAVYTKPRLAMHFWVSSVAASDSTVCWENATSA